MRLIVASLVKNEANRYWKSCLSAWGEFADAIVVLDDRSVDKTAAIARKHPKAIVLERYGARDAWGAESEARRELWDAAMEQAEVGDVVLWLDADMVPLRDPRELLRPHIDTYFFALYDLWQRDPDGRLWYREDEFWNGHMRPRAWAVRKPRDFKAEWGTRGLHCGHLPTNWRPERAFFAPPDYSLLHYGYLDGADRLTKALRYASEGEQLTPQERTHAASILDSEPLLKTLLVKPRWELKRK